jgi:hypothetical protein
MESNMLDSLDTLFEEVMPEPRKMPLVFGGHLRLEDIVGRDKLVERVIYTLNSSSVIINEIRRFGKTSFLRLLESKAPSNWICVRTTVQGARTTAELVETTLRDILSNARGRERIRKHIIDVGNTAKNAKVNIKGVEFSLNEAHKANALSVFRSVLSNIGKRLIKDNQFMVIMWDEFPDALHSILNNEGKSAANEFMKSFRALRENSESQNIRWALTGSIGLHHILSELSGRDSINDLNSISLDPLGSPHMKWMSMCLLLEINKVLEGSDFLADVSGGIPFVLVMMVKYIRDFGACVPQNAAEAEGLLIDSASDVNVGTNWAPLLERVGKHYGQHVKAAEAVLDIIAAAQIEETMISESLKARISESVDDSTLEKILTLLLEDHYIKYDNSSRLYSWKHEPLRLIWKARRRKGM